MGKIHILPEELSNRIAAGEVVERPASVVKELVENAVDAGADAVSIEIERAGSRLIRVTDNGSGMDADDALLAFSPHGTSKIKAAADIDRILTLGFRGEALPSIASVARISLKTRTADTPEGVEIEIEGGRLLEQKPAGLAVGTVVAVRDLFFNVPARKKFLRSPATEEAHIQETVISLALGFPHVALSLQFDGRPALRAPGAATPAARVAGLFGRNFAGRMLEVDYREGELAIRGLIAAPGFTRPNRREQRTFVNGRAVESPALYRGIRDGYGTLADFGRFPPVMLNLETDPADYDINVHPTKREVRFKHEYAISHAFEAAVRETLRGAPAPEMKLPDAPSLARPDALLAAAEVHYQPGPAAVPIPGLEPAAAPEDDGAETPEPKTISPPPAPPVSLSCATLRTALAARDAEPKFTDRDGDVTLPPAPPVRSQLAEELADSENLRYLGIAFETFVVVEAAAPETLLVIDFHAAHERVLYERLLERAQHAAAAPSQALLLPLTVELSRTAAGFLAQNEKLFTALGFDLALLSSNTVMLNAIPAALPSSADWERILSDAVAAALEGERNVRANLEAIARAACHAAVKAHDPLNEVSAQALLRDLARCVRPDVCPHGRPTVLRISRTELARRFGRL